MSLPPVSPPVSPQAALNPGSNSGPATANNFYTQTTTFTGFVYTGTVPQLPNRWQGFENFGKRFGWIISVLSLLASSSGVIIAATNLSNTIKTNSEAQKRSAISQALITLQNPAAPGVRRSLELIAREGISVAGINLDGAYLERAKLTQLRAGDASFEHSKMNGADFSSAEIENSSFAGSAMSGSNFRGIGRPPVAAKVVEAELRPVKRKERDPAQVIVVDGYYRMKFSNAILRGAAFDGASIRDALFDGANLRDATFIGATLTGADFTNADTANTDFSGADLGSGLSTTRITQKQLDAACAAPDQKPIVPNGMRPPSKNCE